MRIGNTIFIAPGPTTYQLDKAKGIVRCTTYVFLKIIDKDEGHPVYTGCFRGKGLAHCTRNNYFDEDFGKAIALVKANKDVANKINMSLVKYSSNHFIKNDSANDCDWFKLSKFLSKNFKGFSPTKSVADEAIRLAGKMKHIIEGTKLKLNYLSRFAPEGLISRSDINEILLEIQEWEDEQSS